LTSNLLTANISSLGVLNSNIASLNITSSNIATGNVTGLGVLNLNAATVNLFNSNLTTANISTLGSLNANIATLNVFTSNTATGNVTSLGVLTANINSANLVTANISTLTSLNSNLATLNVFTSNTATGNVTSLGVLTANVATLNVNLSNTTTGNVVSLTSNLANLTYLTVTSNILPASATGNTYLTGNIVVSGNVFSALGDPLGSGGGYYLSLPSDIAMQTPYTGALYGPTFPLSVGLSNGFTITGTSTLISVTAQGNFKFSRAGVYKLSAVFLSSENVNGLALGSNVADIHGQDQGYMYRYTTFISQNPTELIEIPLNITDTSLYYYLDLFKVDGGILHQTTDPRGGTYLTITPLQGGGLASGGPGGTPGTQWVSSGSNIYYANSVGIGAINPAYKLDVDGDMRVTGSMYGNMVYPVASGLTSNYISSGSDYYIGVNGARQVTLPLGSTIPIGKTYVVKDEAGNASVSSILLQASGSDVIDGNSNVTMALNNISLTIIWTGTRWSLF
jgi:hypothetical protein